jgi:hypothetical protein
LIFERPKTPFPSAWEKLIFVSKEEQMKKNVLAAITIFVIAVLAVGLVSFKPTITVYAWSAPTVTPLCAPDSTHFSFNVNLASGEADYNMEWAWDSGFTGATSIPLLAGDNPVPISRGTHNSGDTWYIRFVSDYSAVGSAHADGTLCNTPVPTSTNTYVFTPTNTLPPEVTPTNTLPPEVTPTNTLPPEVTPTNTLPPEVTPTNTSVPPQESTPIPPPVTGGSSGPNGSPILPIVGTLALLTILGLALKSRKAIGPTK